MAKAKKTKERAQNHTDAGCDGSLSGFSKSKYTKPQNKGYILKNSK